MQSVSAAFTAEEKDTVRKIVQSLQVSWHKDSLLSSRTFTIGISLIGSSDFIGINPGAIGSPGNYRYFDESAYVTSLNWERGYNMPTGGLTKAMAEANLDNTSGRFLPRYVGGHSELFTAIVPGKPTIINAGFNFNGVDQMLAQFAGIISEQPQISMRNKLAMLKMEDYVHFFQNRKLDTAVIFTAQRTDQVITTLFSQLGMSTAQYDLDTGINIIPFGNFDVGITFAEALHELVEAENGHLYQDEQGIFKFENRQHWSNAPYTQVQRVITTSQVIDAEVPDTSHLINVVEVNSDQYQKQPEQTIFRFNPFDSQLLPAGVSKDILINFDDPVLSMITPSAGGTSSYFQATSNPDGTGTDLSGNIRITSVARFAQAARLTFSNTGTNAAYLTNMVISGRVARSTSTIYTRAVAGASVTAYQEQTLTLNNRFIQNQSWAESYANMIITDFKNPENIQKITIKAQPDLQLGDLISWQGRYWRIFDIKVTLDPSVGFTQELLLLQRSPNTYFRIGISTIGGSDRIAP